MTEMLDTFDADLNRVGSAERDLVHADGLWHRTFHLWLVSARSGGSILYQRRSDDKGSFPGMLDISAAGHLEVGEEPKDGIREVEEELGISIPFASMEFLGYRIEVSDSGGKKNREHQAVFMATAEHSLSDFAPDPLEVNGLVWLEISKLNDLFSGSLSFFESLASIYSEPQGFSEKTIRIEKSVFLPRIQPYYVTINIMAERYLQGVRPISI
jgi:isopentenyldiphosphate isomerase